MHIERDQVGGDVLLKVAGRLDTPNAKPFEASLMEVVSTTGSGIVVNLAGVDYVSSSGLRALLVAGKAMRNAKRRQRWRRCSRRSARCSTSPASRPCSRSPDP